MIFRTAIQDCLALNWAVPSALLKSPPAPLSFDTIKTSAGEFVFVSAMLFRQERLLPAAGLPRVSQPQCQFHALAIDGEGEECRWVSGILLPSWLAASVRWVAGRPARGARLEFPSLGEPGCQGDTWRWSVETSSRLEVEACLASPSALKEPGAEDSPSLGNFKKTLAYFQKQRSDYALVRGKWHKVDVERESAEAMPVAVDVHDDRLLADQLGLEAEVPPIHSAWLVPTITASFEYAAEKNTAALPQAPASL